MIHAIDCFWGPFSKAFIDVKMLPLKYSNEGPCTMQATLMDQMEAQARHIWPHWPPPLPQDSPTQLVSSTILCLEGRIKWFDPHTWSCFTTCWTMLHNSLDVAWCIYCLWTRSLGKSFLLLSTAFCTEESQNLKPSNAFIASCSPFNAQFLPCRLFQWPIMALNSNILQEEWFKSP